MQTFDLGDRVRVKSGPRAPCTGEVTGINRAKSLLKVARDLMSLETATRGSHRQS